MSAYVLAFVDVHDRTRFAHEYVPALPGTLEPYGGRVLAASDDASTLEGTVPVGRTVIIEFPDMESAHRWYASDVYGPLRALRESIATTSLITLPGTPTAHDSRIAPIPASSDRVLGQIPAE